MIVEAIATFSLAVWLYLIFARGGFWRCAERDDEEPAQPAAWPRIAVVIPARNEAEVIAACIGSLVRQDYAGEFMVILVDDDSSDGTAAVARNAAADAGAAGRLTVISGR